MAEAEAGGRRGWLEHNLFSLPYLYTAVDDVNGAYTMERDH